jgi:hypothetical protein
MSTGRSPIPFRPDYSARSRDRVSVLTRSLTAHVLSKIHKGEHGSPDDFAKQLWQDDREVERMTRSADPTPNGRVIKAAVEPASTMNTPDLLETMVADLIVLLGEVAGAEVLTRTLRFTFDRNAVVSVPAFLADAGYASFVREGDPAPIFALQLTPLLLELHKIMTGTVLTSEMLKGSPINVETKIKDALQQCIALALNAALFDANAGVPDLRPAGLRNGIAALPASAAADPVHAMLADVSTVAGAVAPVAGNTPIVLVADPVHAMMLRGHRKDLPTDIVLGSSSLTPGVLIAIAPNAIASSMGDVEVEVSDQAAIHMSTTPTDIGMEGTPTFVASPVLSLFQTDCVALLPRLDVSWARRDDRAVSWLTATGW